MEAPEAKGGRGLSLRVARDTIAPASSKADSNAKRNAGQGKETNIDGLISISSMTTKVNMSRRRQQLVLDDVFEMLKVAPIWVGPVLAVIVFIAFRFILPLCIPAKQPGVVDAGVMFRPLLQMMSWAFPLVIMGAWVLAEGWKLFNRNLLNKQTGTECINAMSWQDFERLICEAYRRKGYLAEVIGNNSGDGGVDVRLNGHGETVLVQCKQWKAYKVGVNIVRELLGVVVSEKASRGIVVTSGRFTQEARAFVRQNRQIELVDGDELAVLIRGLQGKPTPSQSKTAAGSSPVTPNCPMCGDTMVLRTAKKGQNAGSAFWGCPKYPSCKGTRPVAKSR